MKLSAKRGLINKTIYLSQSLDDRPACSRISDRTKTSFMKNKTTRNTFFATSSDLLLVQWQEEFLLKKENESKEWNESFTGFNFKNDQEFHSELIWVISQFQFDIANLINYIVMQGVIKQSIDKASQQVHFCEYTEWFHFVDHEINRKIDE